MTRAERHVSRSEKRDKWITDIARTRGSILRDIEQYIRVGMRPSEIATIRRLQTGREPDKAYRQKIANAMGHRTRKGLPFRTPEERRKARVDALFESEDDRERRVIVWLNRMANTPKDDWPDTRQRWIDPTDKIKIDIALLATDPRMYDIQLGQPLPVKSYPLNTQLVIRAIDIQEVPLEDSTSLLTYHCWEPTPKDVQEKLSKMGISMNQRHIKEFLDRMIDLAYEYRKFREVLSELEGQARRRR